MSFCSFYFKYSESGCFFQYRSDEYELMAYTNWEYDTLWINLNGKDTQFKLTKSMGMNSLKKGSSLTKFYKNGAQTIKMVITSTGSACPDNEECESTGVSATFKINDGKETKTVRTKGACGS